MLFVVTSRMPGVTAPIRPKDNAQLANATNGHLDRAATGPFKLRDGLAPDLELDGDVSRRGTAPAVAPSLLRRAPPWPSAWSTSSSAAR